MISCRAFAQVIIIIEGILYCENRRAARLLPLISPGLHPGNLLPRLQEVLDAANGTVTEATRLQVYGDMTHNVAWLTEQQGPLCAYFDSRFSN